jgi:hypothetical protein
MAEDDWRTITVNVEEDAISLVFDKGHCHSSIGGAGARLTVSWAGSHKPLGAQPHQAA